MRNSFLILALAGFVLAGANAYSQTLPEKETGWEITKDGSAYYSVHSRFLCPFKLSPEYELTKAHNFEGTPDVGCTYESHTKGDYTTFYLYPVSQFSIDDEIEGTSKPILKMKTNTNNFVTSSISSEFANAKIIGKSISAKSQSENKTEAITLFDYANFRLKVRETYFGDQTGPATLSKNFFSIQKEAAQNIMVCETISRLNKTEAKTGGKMMAAILGGTYVTSLMSGEKKKSSTSTNEQLPANTCVLSSGNDGGGKSVSVRASTNPTLPYFVVFEKGGMNFEMGIGAIIDAEAKDSPIYFSYKIEGDIGFVYDYFESLPSVDQALDVFSGIFSGDTKPAASASLSEKGEVQISIDSSIVQ